MSVIPFFNQVYDIFRYQIVDGHVLNVGLKICKFENGIRSKNARISRAQE